MCAISNETAIMNKYGLIISLLLIISCRKADDTIKVYTWKEYEKALHKNPKQKIIIDDTICPFERKRALEDIKKGILVYQCYSPIPYFVMPELNILLRSHKITAIKGSSSCIPPPKGFTDNCYENIMWSEIEKRYGQEWIDSIEKLAVKNYVIKHPDVPYDENGIDLRTKYLKN